MLLSLLLSLLLLLVSTAVVLSVSTASTASSYAVNPPLWGVANTKNKATTNSSITNTSNTTTILPRWKQALPLDLQQRATLQRIVISKGSSCYTQVYLLGTSHVSNDSSADVKLLLETTRPDVVFLELCEQRTGMLEHNTSSTTTKDSIDSNATFWQRVQLVQQSEGGMTRASALGTVLLTQVQSDYAKSLGVELGSEFQVAHNYCLQNPVTTTCILGDRPLQLTLLRAWESLRWWGKTRVVLGLLWNCMKRQDPDELRQWMQSILIKGETDVLTESIQELKRHFPTLERVIIQERDAYLACKLFQCCRLLPRDVNHTIVAIVGAGHVPGMVHWLTQPCNQTPEEILSPLVVTKKKWNGKQVWSYVTDVTQLTIRHGV